MVLLLFAGCKKTVEGEQNAWKSNVDKVNGLMAKYPGFKPALEQRMEAAKTVHAESEGLSGEALIEKLSAANTALTRGFVDKLGKLDGQMKKLRSARAEVATKAGDSSRMGAKVAAEDAQKALDRAEAALKSGAKDEASATAVVDKVVDDLKTAQKVIDKVLNVDKKKKDQKASDKKAAETKAEEAKAAAEAKVAPWTCEYCGSENPHTEGKCKSCGAPKGKKK